MKNLKSENGKIVYFLGAGATKAVAQNAPLNKELLKKALSDFQSTPEAERLNDFIERLFPWENRIIDNQIWNLFDYIIQEGKSPCFDYNLEQIVALRKDLLDLVIQEFQESLGRADQKIYKKFADKIKHVDSTIISTNYDIIIDNALLGKVNYNYGTKIRKIVASEFGEELGLRRPGHYAPISMNTGSLSLLKIHGSLNWLYCPKCDEVDVSFGEKGVIKTLKGLYCINENCTKKYEALLITPTMFKNYENRIFRETWECAEKKLIEAKKMVFIGYSLKDEDYQIRCLLMKALLDKMDPYEKITVVEKKPENAEEKKYVEDLNKKYNELYGNVDFQPIGFKEYVEKLTT